MKKIILLFAFVICFISTNINAKDQQPNFNDFGAWTVLNGGHVKTMDSFARSTLYTISGATSVNGISATEWMANTIFDPSSSINIPVIKVNKQTILDLNHNNLNLYSMDEVIEALRPYQEMVIALEQRNPEKLSAPQKNLLNTYQAVTLYNQIIQSFSAVLPLSGQEKTYIDGGGIKEQRKLILEGGRDNNLLKFIPNNHPHMTHISLWSAINNDLETPIIPYIKTMAITWNNGDYNAWNETSKTVKDLLYVSVENKFSLKLEQYYVAYQPVIWAMSLYIIGGILLLLKPMKRLATGMISVGFLIHLLSLITRSIILERPPTGTLYETLLFGSIMAVLVGLFVFFKNKNQSLFLIGCAISAAFLLFISRGFIQGDSLNVLVAVLNTNFWLSTHVTCIIIGYSFCIMAAVTAHIVLINPASQAQSLLMPMALIALLFTSVGTLLGGIWADQSWGRFWGWDPKENGALLIVLWLIWILHGRLSGHFSKISFACALALTNIMVATTWFGVNLLGVGLHSYGFISNIALGLSSFCTLQLLIVGGLYYKNKKATK